MANLFGPSPYKFSSGKTSGVQSKVKYLPFQPILNPKERQSLTGCIKTSQVWKESQLICLSDPSSDLTDAIPPRAQMSPVKEQRSGAPFNSPVPTILSGDLLDQQLNSKRRSRLDEFLTNNSCSSDSLARVTHVLCCPTCPFMSLQESVLVEHTATCSGMDSSKPNSSVSSISSSVIVHRCCLCLGTSTELDLMREHMAIYHGLCKGEADLQLTWSRVSPGRSVDTVGPAPTGSRKRKSHVPERIHSLWTAQVSAADCPKSPKMLLMSVGDGDCPKAAVASPLDVASPATANCDILDLSLKRLADASSADEAAEASPPKARQQKQQKLQRQDSQEQSLVGKPQRQNFSDAQNSLLQSWFSEHRDKPYPSTADTRQLAELTRLNYSQVKKWFANRRMRTKTPGSAGLLASDGLCGELTFSEMSSGKASPSNLSATDFRSENSPA